MSLSKIVNTVRSIRAAKYSRDLIPTAIETSKKIVALATIVLKNATWRDCGIISALLLYYRFLKFAHEKMDAGWCFFAISKNQVQLRFWIWKTTSSYKILIPLSFIILGPIVLILTALIAIFTVGLDDGSNNNNGRNSMSAYSVFNRGFSRMLGNVDVENLVAQHVGGAMAMHARPVAANGEHWNDANGGADNDGQPPLLDDDDDSIIDDDNQNAQGRRPRRTGKKKRRQNNIEKRRDRQRQRELAREMNYVDVIGE